MENKEKLKLRMIKILSILWQSTCFSPAGSVPFCLGDTGLGKVKASPVTQGLADPPLSQPLAVLLPLWGQSAVFLAGRGQSLSCTYLLTASLLLSLPPFPCQGGFKKVTSNWGQLNQISSLVTPVPAEPNFSQLSLLNG